MNPHQLLHTRRTIHHYVPNTPIPQEALDRALAAAHMAPNHKFTWPWRFLLVGPETREKIVPIAIATKAQKKFGSVDAADDAFKAMIRNKITSPSALIVALQTRSDNAFQSREDYASCACAIHNITLSLHADGFGSKWSTGGVTTHPDTYALLNIDESAEEIVGFVWAGTPLRVPTVKRPPVEDIVRTLP